MTEKKPFYTIKELAEAIHVSVSTVHNYIREEVVKAYRLNGKGSWRIKPAEFRRVVRESK